MKKHITAKQIETALTMLSNNGMVAQGSFIFGDPAETMQTATETLEFYRARQDIVKGASYLGFIIPFPGSEDYKYCLNMGIIKDEKELVERRVREGYNPKDPINMTRMSPSEFKQLKEKIIETDFIAKKYSVVNHAIHDNGKNIIDVDCPYCKQTSIFFNAGHLPSGLIQGVEVGCRHCGGRFIAAPSLYPVVHSVIQIIGFNNARNIRNKFKTIFSI
jgi:hypothetical protein